ncbi:MAG: VOC family protein [Chloroflexi bacterium]|nr:VOC family protein [Chloroflexota bacterium]
MAKIKHIAIRSADTEATARFFVEVFGLELVQRRQHGPIDLSDGDVNITVLPLDMGNNNGRVIQPGFEHIGFSVEDQDETRERLMAHGATELNPVVLGDAYYESKFKSSEGFVVDVGHWRGTSPLPQTAAANAT